MDIAGWDEKYRTGERGSEDAATPLLIQTAETLSPGAALDLACGTGRNALFLAKHGWTVTAIDGSEHAIAQLRERAAANRVQLKTQVADLTAQDFPLPGDAFDLVLIAFYLQRTLFPVVKQAVRPGGTVVAIAHIPDPGEPWTDKRAAPGELREFFHAWEILWTYEGPSRDSAHRRPVAEIVARRPRPEGC